LGQPIRENESIPKGAKSMANVFLRPDLKTAGGEVSDILLNGRYVGSLSIVYREHQRVSGAIQLDQLTLPYADKDFVLNYIHNYIQAFAGSVEAAESRVYTSFSSVDCYVDLFEQNADEDDMEDDIYFDDVDEEIETLEMDGKVYHLVIVGEGRSNVEYHVYDEEQEWAAEAFVSIQGADVSGEIHWLFDPTEEEIEAITELLMSDFDEEDIDTIVLNHHYESALIETIDLKYDEQARKQTEEVIKSQDDQDYTIVLARDDGDVLTYEIYEQSHGHLPIGTATIDIGQRVLTGFIDFRKLESTEDLDTIAALLMLELDKEREYVRIHLTSLYQNEPIDEISIDCEQMH
jgi:hypothetical protein